MTKSSPSRTARVVIAMASEPPSASVIAWAPIASPEQIRGSQRSFCSTVPNCWSGIPVEHRDVVTEKLRPESRLYSPRPSNTYMVVRSDCPRPP